MARTVVVDHTLDQVPLEVRRPIRHAYEILHWGFVLLPVVAGLDKFSDVLVRWERYLADPIARMFPFTKHQVMMGVGIVEIIAAFVVAVKPSVGAYIVAAWLVGIIVNLLIVGGYWDIALRDFGLVLGAIALGRLARARETVTVAE